ncbi:hypothetical protein TWF481_000265 [Arthrobotrys musiformis]|uniref:Uncharacterized protein n=1 Tax=Arthrobotrys musiformis TaxID=47236 RepID=A0AAV9WNP8_9PEZI
METQVHQQLESSRMRSRFVQPKKTNYTSLLFILSVSLSFYFSKEFGLLPLVRAEDAGIPIDTSYDGTDWVGPDRILSPPVWRSQFHLGGGIWLACYPSNVDGWLYVPDVSTVELDFLGIDRFKPQNRSFNQTEEDAFCERIQLLDPLHDRDNPERAYLPPPDDPENKLPRVRNIFCWPKTGGAWVKKLSYMAEWGWWDGGEIKVTTEGEPSLVGAIWNAHSMEERCQAFERAEGKFCAKLEYCEETKRFIGKKIWLDD